MKKTIYLGTLILMIQIAAGCASFEKQKTREIASIPKGSDSMGLIPKGLKCQNLYVLHEKSESRQIDKVTVSNTFKSSQTLNPAENIPIDNLIKKRTFTYRSDIVNFEFELSYNINVGREKSTIELTETIYAMNPNDKDYTMSWGVNTFNTNEGFSFQYNMLNSLKMESVKDKEFIEITDIIVSCNPNYTE